MSHSWIHSLKKRIGPSLVRTDSPTLKENSQDAWHATAKPEVVVFPKKTSDVQKTVLFCAKKGIPITARGAGRGYVGGCVPVKGGVALSFKKMNRILEISPQDSCAVVQPGVITGILQQKALAKGLYYPPDPASLNESSIGGNIATNAGGPRCLKYGVTKHYVLGLKVVLASGKLVETGGRTHKNKHGFNLSDMFVGSEGMLGIVTEATLRLIPYPSHRGAVIASFEKAKEASQAVQAIQKAGILPSAMEVADRFTLEAARRYTSNVPPGNAFILVEVDGQKKSVSEEIKTIHHLLQNLNPLEIRKAKTTAACEKLWDMRRAFSYSLKATGLTKLNQDIVVPRSRLTDLFKFAEKLQRKYKVSVASFGHAGDGNIHVNLMIKKSQEKSSQTQDALDALFSQVMSWDGKITGEHGIGLAKKPWWDKATSPELRFLHHTIKDALDPKGILNPGKFLG